MFTHDFDDFFTTTTSTKSDDNGDDDDDDDDNNTDDKNCEDSTLQHMNMRPSYDDNHTNDDNNYDTYLCLLTSWFNDSLPTRELRSTEINNMT